LRRATALPSILFSTLNHALASQALWPNAQNRGPSNSVTPELLPL
jgi:hypothetical protein